MKTIYLISVTGLLLSATAAGVTVLYSRLNRTNSGGSKQILRITAVPPGEAPEWVRQAWVGVRMPLATRGPGVRSARVVGVISGPHSFLAQLKQILSGRGRREQGYCVRVTDAPWKHWNGQSRMRRSGGFRAPLILSVRGRSFCFQSIAV